MDIPPGPAPTTKPAKKTQVLIERRKQIAAAKPAATQPAAATQAAAKPATTSTTTAATAPAIPATTQAAVPPPSTWELKTDPKGDADDEGIQALLDELHPLKATKFFESASTTKPTAGYVIKVTTEGPGGTPVTGYEIKLIDPGSDQPLLADYNGLNFELPRTFLPKLEGNFAKKPKSQASKVPINPEDFKGPGEK